MKLANGLDMTVARLWVVLLLQAIVAARPALATSLCTSQHAIQNLHASRIEAESRADRAEYRSNQN